VLSNDWVVRYDTRYLQVTRQSRWAPAGQLPTCDKTARIAPPPRIGWFQRRAVRPTLHPIGLKFPKFVLVVWRPRAAVSCLARGRERGLIMHHSPQETFDVS
jgi:hypothetical protein